MLLDKPWHDYNESLIERGRILMDIGFIKSWNKVYGDKAYDNRMNFNILDDINAEPAISSIRKNASTTISKGCPLRRDEVLLIKKLGYEGWKQLKDADRRRWIAEIVFSSIKRTLGENLLSKKFKAQKVEAGLKVMLYNNKFISL